jgi:hypothetical protein
MGPDFDDDELSLDHEAVERREEPRGLVHEFYAEVPGLGRCQVAEASRKGFFARVADPERVRLGDTLDVQVERGERRIGCKVEVVRKEIHPRRGVVLRIVHIGPVAEESLRLMLE